MSLKRFLARLLNSALRRRDDKRLQEEIEEHLALQTADNLRAGLSPSEARRQALLKFGAVEAIQEEYWAEGGLAFLEILLQDYRFGWRSLRKSPGFTAVAVFSLAIGIGSCVAAFRLIDALLWRPQPISGSSRLYVLSRKLAGPEGKPIEDGYWATPDFKLMRDVVMDQADLIAISYADRTDITWSTDDDMEKAHVAYASGDVFPLFGLEPALGRLLAPANDRGPGADPYAVLSWDYWNHRFGRDPHVLGRSLHIGDQTFEIIGVGPRDFTGTEKGTVTDIFLPLNSNSPATRESDSWHHIFL